jgi:hypothetical protein
MNVTLECWCGMEMETSGEVHQSESDLRAECDDCGRGYVLTLTQYSEPTMD